MASIPGTRFDLSGATGSQGVLAPKDGWKCYFLPRGGHASQDSTGTRVNFDSATIAARFTVGDWIQAGLNTANIRQVGAVGGDSIVVSGAALTVAENDRIFLIGATEPTISGGSATYTPRTTIRQRADDAADLYVNSMITTNSNGLAQPYGGAALYDVLLQDGNRNLQGAVVDLPIGVVEGISVTDAAFFGDSVSIYGTLHSKRGPGQIRWAEEFATGSRTNGIQEAITDLNGATGSVWLSPKVLGNTDCVWVPSNVTVVFNGAQVYRLTGSMANGSTANSGPVFSTGPTPGTLFSSSTIGKNIAFIGPGVIDGNSSGFGALTDTNLGLFGIRAMYVDGITIRNIRIQNMLQDAVNTNNCKGINYSGIYGVSIGFWSTTATRNFLSFYNSDNSTTFTNQGTVTGYRCDDCGDEILTCAGTQGLAVGEGSSNGGDFGIEFTGSGTIPFQNNTFANLTFKNLLDACITLAPTVADVDRCNFVALEFDCHGTSHSGQLIYLGAQGVSYSKLTFSDITANNLNSLNTTAKNWIDIQTGAASNKTGLVFSKIVASGFVGSTRTADVGINIRGKLDNVRFTDVLLKDVAGIGVAIDDSDGTTMHQIIFDKLTVDGCNFWGAMTRNNGATSTNWIKEVYWNTCTMKDTSRYATGIGNGDAAWYFENGASGATISNNYLRNCRAVRTTGTSMNYGVYLNQGAGGVDNIHISGCDFSGMALDWFKKTGTPTNIRFVPPGGQGTTIATSATISIPPDGSWFQVSGSTAISGISWNPWDNGRTVKLLFLNGTTVNNVLTGAKVASTFSIAAAYSLRFTGTSGYWNEDSRSANA